MTEMPTFFVDTSAWFDIVNSRAPHHAELSRLVRQTDVLLVTTTYILAELAALLLARSGHALAAEVGTTMRSTRGIRIEHPDLAEESRAWRLFLDRPDKTYSLTDCLSFVTMRRLGLDTALATDQHFRQEGFVVFPE
jgi:predicted nucleic acid-binding protein